MCKKRRYSEVINNLRHFGVELTIVVDYNCDRFNIDAKGTIGILP